MHSLRWISESVSAKRVIPGHGGECASSHTEYTAGCFKLLRLANNLLDYDHGTLAECPYCHLIASAVRSYFYEAKGSGTAVFPMPD
jgi:hypothetical protein